MRTLLTGLATITAISAIAATPAAALTKVGTFVSPGTTSWSAMADLPFGDATGLYLLTFDLSRAGAGQFIGRATKSFEFYCFEDHEHCGGDDHPVEKVQDFAHATHLEMLFKINPPYVRDLGGGYTEEGYYYDGHAILMATFTGTSSVNYSITANRIGDAVPEPASWALMIVGFGATGAALRRRRLGQDALRL